MKIMIVGNDCELAALTGKMLERSGYNAVCSSCGEEVTAQLENENIGLVIAELDNDENERICFCKAVKGAKKPPKLLLIGRSGEEEIPMLNAGADDWIKKPYRTDVFLARVSALMRQCENSVLAGKREEY